MKIVCVLHEDERILDVTRDADHYTIREWESGQRQEIRLSENEVSRVVQVLMEMQQERRLDDKSSAIAGLHLEPAGPFGTNRY
ncbi:MAG: hypothetical protein WA628_18350 [Terriglobales bacterium]